MENKRIKTLLSQTGIIFLSAVLIALAFNAFRPNGLDIFSSPKKDKPVKPGILNVNLKAMEEKIAHPEVLILDARPEAEYAAGHIKGAKNFPLNGLDDWIEDFIATVDPEKEIITYCSGPSCAQAAEVAALLLDMGYKHVSYFPGGMDQWTSSHLPVETQ